MNSIMLKQLFGFLLLSTLSLNSFAACNCDEEEDEDDDIYKSYSYLGIKSGTNSGLAQTLLPGTNNALGIYFGYRATKNFGVEFDATSFGKYTTSLGLLEVTAATISGVHQLEITKGMVLFGKLGLTSTQVGTAMTLQHTDFSYGAGLEFDINRSLILRAGYERYSLNLGTGLYTNNVTYGGLALKF